MKGTVGAEHSLGAEGLTGGGRWVRQPQSQASHMSAWPPTGPILHWDNKEGAVCRLSMRNSGRGPSCSDNIPAQVHIEAPSHRDPCRKQAVSCVRGPELRWQRRNLFGVPRKRAALSDAKVVFSSLPHHLVGLWREIQWIITELNWNEFHHFPIMPWGALSHAGSIDVTPVMMLFVYA